MAPIKTNNPYASYFDFFSRTGTDAVNPSPVPAPGLTATGGIISDYESSGTYYRAHVFTSSGSFDVTELGDAPADVEYLVVAGGGGGGTAGGGNAGGGGGAGGLRTNLTGHPLAGSTFTVSTSPGQYTVTIGGGGQGAAVGSPLVGVNGVDSVFGSITSNGGGGGGGPSSGNVGGSGGGGGGATSYTGGSGNSPTPTNPAQGNDGGPGYNSNPYVGGGGGGAGEAGNTDGYAHGGDGVQVVIAGPAADTTGVGALNPSTSQYQWFAGGGGGGSYPSPNAAGPGGIGGGGNGNVAPNPGASGVYATGGGGGGGGQPGGNPTGGNGGSGIVIVRYQIDSSQSGSAKASGGVISYYNNKTIHAFTSSGEFTAPATFNETVEYVVVGGGGAGGGPSAPGVNSYYGGGGGAGAYRKGSTPISTPQTIAIQVGAGGAKGQLLPAAGTPSYFGSPITSPGGGYGATWQDPGGQPTVNGGPGGSSGGANYGGPGTTEPSTGDNFSPTDATANTPVNGWGHPGGTGNPSGNSGGGGGAGGAGQNADPSNAGDGGAGMQLPTTFRDPAQSFGAPGPTNTSVHNPGWTNLDNSGKYWVAGGGGGGSYGPNASYTPGGGGTNTHGPGSFAGAGEGSRFFSGGTAALQNTGSGGGGMERYPGGPSPQPDAGNGGSGLVLIAYPT
jgi:hypothetical protein